MLLLPEFDTEEVDPDLHKRMNKAVEDGRIKCFNIRESNLDGDQDLSFWIREVEDSAREIMEDPIFKGNQNYKFEMDVDEAGKRLYGGEANAGVAFQRGQLRYVLLFRKYTLVCTRTYWYIHFHFHFDQPLHRGVTSQLIPRGRRLEPNGSPPYRLTNHLKPPYLPSLSRSPWVGPCVGVSWHREL